jgi:hypothetical protein
MEEISNPTTLETLQSDSELKQQIFTMVADWALDFHTDPKATYGTNLTQEKYESIKNAESIDHRSMLVDPLYAKGMILVRKKYPKVDPDIALTYLDNLTSNRDQKDMRYGSN